jgi:hypothetical protein
MSPDRRSRAPHTQSAPCHRRGLGGFVHLHDEPDPYGSPPPLQAGDCATTEWPLFHPIRQMFVRQEWAPFCAAQVSSGSFLFGVNSVIFRRTEMYVPVSKWQCAMKTVNLNQYRKQRRRAEAQRRAMENRVSFGRNKAERSKDRCESARAEKEIEGKRLD